MALHRHIPQSLWVASLLIIIVVIIFIQIFTPLPTPAPVPVNASTGLSPEATPGATGADNTGTSGTPPELNRTGPGVPATPTDPEPATIPAMGSREIPRIDISSLELKVHARINSVRQEHNLSVLGMDVALASLARAHSRDMAANGYFGHLNLQERDATARGAAVGYTCHRTADPYFTYAIAENIFATYQYGPVILADGRTTGYAWSTEDEIAEEAVDAWMHSPDHRDNILDPYMEREGIGIAISEDQLVFITQDLC